MSGAAPHEAGTSAPRLKRLIERAPTRRPSPAAEERCELCGEPVPPEHRHLLDVEQRKLLCACRACSLLFDRREAGGGHFRLIPGRCRRVEDFALSAGLWEELRIPVELAFFIHSTPLGRVAAFYPGPMGPTESLLRMEAWDELVAANPVLRELEPDTEALLVNRARGAESYWLVPVDECYRLAGLFRSRWRGFGGGAELWAAIDEYFAALARRASPVHRDGSRTRTAGGSDGKGDLQRAGR
jgi:hypothetical protein